MPLIDLTRQTNLTVDVANTLDVQGVIDIVGSGLEIDSASVTFSAAEANILTGATLSTTELNYVTGVTSSIQTQLGNIVDGTTDFTGDIDIGASGTPRDLTVWGNLAVLGSGIIFDTETIQAEDPIIQTNYSNGVAQTATDGGLQVGRSGNPDAQIIWKQAAGRWQFGEVGTIENILGPTSTDTLSNKSIDTDDNTINLGTITNQKKVSTNAELNTAIDNLDAAWFDLFSVSAGKGASMVSIQDAGALIDATTVEGALAENRGALDALEAVGWTATAGGGLTGDATGTLTGGISFTFAIPDGTYTSQTANTFDVDVAAVLNWLDDQALTGANKWTAAHEFDNSVSVLTGNTLTLADSPSAGTDAANKDYIDNHESTVWVNNLVNAPGGFSTASISKVLLYNIHDDFHTAGTANDTSQFLIFVNGIHVESDAITTIVDNGNDIDITFNTGNLGYSLESGDEIAIWGPLSVAP